MSSLSSCNCLQLIPSWWVWTWWLLWTCTWSRATGTSASKQLPSRYCCLPPVPSSSVHVPLTPHLSQSCISLTSSKPQRCLIFIRERSLPYSEAGVRGQAGPGLHMPLASETNAQPQVTTHPHRLVSLIPTSPILFLHPWTELQDSAQVRGFVRDSPDPRGWLCPGTGPVCATWSPC